MQKTRSDIHEMQASGIKDMQDFPCQSDISVVGCRQCYRVVTGAQVQASQGYPLGGSCRLLFLADPAGRARRESLARQPA